VVRLPYQQGALISLFHEAGQVDRIEHTRGSVLMQGRIPGRLLAQFNNWQVDGNHHGNQQEPEEEEEI
jgi:GTP-binding protein HflX